MRIWPALYLAIAGAAALAPMTMSTLERELARDSGAFLFLIAVGIPLQSVFVGVASYRSLVKRAGNDHLRASIWQSPPTNPQSNQLAQILGFGCFGASAALQYFDSALGTFGISGIGVSLALLASLVLFRARYVHAKHGSKR